MIVSAKSRGMGDTATAAGVITSTTTTGIKVGTLILPGVGTAIGAAAGAIAGAVVSLFLRKGPEQKIQATADVNLFEPYFQANLATFQAGQVSKADALQTFDTLWGKLVEALNVPALGEPGQRAIQERGRNGMPPWGQNWFQLYRDPIEQAADPTGGLLPLAPGGVSLTNWLIPAALIVGALVVFK